MKKTMGLLSMLLFVEPGECLHNKIFSSVANVINKVGKTEIGQALGDLGNTALQAGIYSAKNKISAMGTTSSTAVSESIKSNIVAHASSLHNTLAAQVNLIDQQLQSTNLDSNIRNAYLNAKQSYENACVPLSQLVSVAQNTPASLQGSSTLLQQASILGQQAAADLQSTSYAAAANSLLALINSMNTSLAQQTNTIQNYQEQVSNLYQQTVGQVVSSSYRQPVTGTASYSQQPVGTQQVIYSQPAVGQIPMNYYHPTTTVSMPNVIYGNGM